jgi:hypothetical protein
MLAQRYAAVRNAARGRVDKGGFEQGVQEKVARTDAQLHRTVDRLEGSKEGKTNSQRSIQLKQSMYRILLDWSPACGSGWLNHPRLSIEII